MSLRQKFIKRFGARESEKLYLAASSHEKHYKKLTGKDRGNDPFIWALLTVIDYNCISIPINAKCHKLNIAWKEFKQFCVEYKMEIGEYLEDYASAFGNFDWIFNE